MTAALKVRKLPDGRVQARRVDGKPLTPADREEARQIAKATCCDRFADPNIIASMIEHDEAVAVLINSAVLGAPIWFALTEIWKPEDGVKTPVFYPSELPHLRQKTPEQLRKIYETKLAFGPGTKVRQ